MKVVKVGGAALADASWLAGFARAVAAARAPLCIVHGGGPDISGLSDQLGVPVQWHEGRRVTPAAALDVAGMVLNGRVNKRIVGALIGVGVDAVGLSGVDAGVLRAEVLEGGVLGRVGRVTAVRASVLRMLSAAGHTVVLSPISLCDDGGFLNVNADDAAAAVAVAVDASELLFITDVDGVRDGAAVRHGLDAGEATTLVASGVATGGMGVKLQAAVRALECGVPAVRIGDLRTLFDVSAGTLLRPVALGAA